MLLTSKEKNLILKLLKKEKRKKFLSRERSASLKELINKLEQNNRNEKVNDTKPTKL
ncbi:hypothetical protein SAMN04488053_101567 [Alkalicoccus daliensis]|uniref:Uncharacterized protein n=1 Tax=Alkalicoccus daliensis TaxID=745820 RepID=A0A1H0AP70_9BACI|nr:hypothetical protein SAMN04488053_101567 [Alkalicoccus daliensis]